MRENDHDIAKDTPLARSYIRDVAEGTAPNSKRMALAAGPMIVLALATGCVVGFLVFLIMNVSTWATHLLWSGYLEGTSFRLFPLVICTIGGAVIGLWTYYSGCRIESLQRVMATFKRTGTYVLKPVQGAISFLLPLVFGGSVGFEAGLTGLITAGCCWIRDKLKAAGLRQAAVADVTLAASLSAVFGTPLAGIVAGAETDTRRTVAAYDMRRSVKLVLYTAAAFGAYAGIHLLSSVIGTHAGFPRFDAVDPARIQYPMIAAALAVAYVLTLVYHATNTYAARATHLIEMRFGDTVLGTLIPPVLAGLVLGLAACAFPYVMFPGEVEAHTLMESWTTWTALALLATALLKICVTPLCLNMGWAGGNFCPSIFAGAAAGYGLALISGADATLMVTIVVTALLTGVVRKPVLSIAILLLCFPVESIVWCGLAALAGAVLPVPTGLLKED